MNSALPIIIVGGSYAGLAAAMALGRSLRPVLILDAGEPCNEQARQAHNFLTQDGQFPAHIAAISRAQVLQYQGVRLRRALVKTASVTPQGFVVQTSAGEMFHGRKLLLATGVKDQMPSLPGFAACWGITVLHCPYCHGFEVQHQALGVLAAGSNAYEMVQLIHQWSANLTLFSNGPLDLSQAQVEKLQARNVSIIETPVRALEEQGGYLQRVHLADGTSHHLKALFARVPFTQSNSLSTQLGCTLTADGLIAVDAQQRTSVPGVFAAGDNSSLQRAIARAVASGTSAGAFLNHELIVEDF